MHIVIVAGEASGDILGAGLMKALKLQLPEVSFSGVGGQRMIAEGFDSLFPLDRLSVMGFVEPLKRLPELLRIRKTIKQHILSSNAVAFIGIDSPDFNLNIEGFAKANSVAAIHYVSPSVWAWRQGRIKGIKKSVDLMLTLLPFEAEFYRKHEVEVAFVGHPLADDMPIKPDDEQTRHTLLELIPESDRALLEAKKILAVMPGSRSGEVGLLAPLFAEAIVKLQAKDPSLNFVIPCANDARRVQVEEVLQHLSVNVPERILLINGHSHEVMAGADAVLLASGTTALEAMLLKKPMVVAYKLHPFTYFIAKLLVKATYIALPNLLADKLVVPELLQHDATVDNILSELEPLLFDPSKAETQTLNFERLHKLIYKNASNEAANAIVKLLNSRM